MYRNKFLLLLSTEKNSLLTEILYHFFMVQWAFKFFIFIKVFSLKKLNIHHIDSTDVTHALFLFIFGLDDLIKNKRKMWRNLRQKTMRMKEISSRRLIFLPLNWPKDVLSWNFIKGIIVNVILALFWSYQVILQSFFQYSWIFIRICILFKVNFVRLMLATFFYP
jgi:hypothetical protein